MVLSLLSMEKLLKEQGASRVSEEAKEALREALETYARKVCTKAVRYSRHAGRRTIKGEDITLALQE